MKKYQLILFFLISIAVTSCTEVISVDVPQAADKLVVEGYVTTEIDSSYVLLTKSVSYFSKVSIPKVPDALVVINSDTFYHIGNGYYKPHLGYKGVPNTTYNLTIKYQGTNYTSSSTLNPLIQIDTVYQFIYHDKELFAPAGYSLSFNFMFKDQNQYTYFRDGFKNDSLTNGKDSIYGQLVTFDSKNSKYNVWQPFDIPFLRLQPNDTALMMFRSCDQNAFNVYNQIASNSQSGSPFSNPPANLPNNIRGGAIGIFSAQEVRHFRVRIAP